MIFMQRTPLKDRKLPDYTRGEEIFNMVTHIVGGGLAVVILVACVTVAAIHKNIAGVIASIVYGLSMIMLYTMSSVYHGVPRSYAKKVLQVIDHCTVYFLIVGTYTPIAVCALTKVSKAVGWTVFGVVWALAAVAITLTAIDIRKFRVFSMICYIGMGWCIIFAVVTTYRALGLVGFILLVAGGVLYTFGAILYGLGVKRRYMHSVFHIFVILGSLAHFFCIIFYVL